MAWAFAKLTRRLLPKAEPYPDSGNEDPDATKAALGVRVGVRWPRPARVLGKTVR